MLRSLRLVCSAVVGRVRCCWGVLSLALVGSGCCSWSGAAKGIHLAAVPLRLSLWVLLRLGGWVARAACGSDGVATVLIAPGMEPGGADLPRRR